MHGYQCGRHSNPGTARIEWCLCQSRHASRFSWGVFCTPLVPSVCFFLFLFKHYAFQDLEPKSITGFAKSDRMNINRSFLYGLIVYRLYISQMYIYIYIYINKHSHYLRYFWMFTRCIFYMLSVLSLISLSIFLFMYNHFKLIVYYYSRCNHIYHLFLFIWNI